MAAEMTHFNSKTNLSLSRLEESYLLNLSSGVLAEPEFRVVTEADMWLDTAYSLLADQFQPDVLDPLERYVEWLELNRVGKHRFPFLMMVSYYRVQSRAVLMGVLSGNIMKVERYVGPNPGAADDLYIFAIGHQVTDPALRKRDVKGIGTKLWKSAISEATTWIQELDGRFCYSVLEAENDSVGFWTKLGYLWPKGVRYWQPPLEFDETGHYLRPEVPEILMLRPMDPAFEGMVDQEFLQNIIATMYLNWSLEKYRRILSADAMRKAEQHVMGKLFRRVCSKIPPTGPLSLVPWPHQRAG